MILSPYSPAVFLKVKWIAVSFRITQCSADTCGQLFCFSQRQLESMCQGEQRSTWARYSGDSEPQLEIPSLAWPTLWFPLRPPTPLPHDPITSPHDLTHQRINKYPEERVCSGPLLAWNNSKSNWTCPSAQYQLSKWMTRTCSRQSWKLCKTRTLFSLLQTIDKHVPWLSGQLKVFVPDLDTSDNSNFPHSAGTLQEFLPLIDLINHYYLYN